MISLRSNISSYDSETDNKILIVVGILGIICIVLMSGCITEEKQEEITCNKPYIKVGNECCLDKDDNGICDKDEQTIKTEEEKQEEVTCNKPYIKVGNECCLDNNDNNICDKDEQTPETEETKQEEVTCNKPYIKVGIGCCLDTDDNGICDKDEEEIPNETEEELSGINKSKVRVPFDKTVEIDKTKIIPTNETEEETLVGELKPMTITGIAVGCTEKRITTNNANQMSPAIHGDKIVWMDERNGNRDIYMYDLTTNTEKRITTNNADQEIPAIHGDKIVWQDHRSSKSQIYMYDLKTNTEKQITSGSVKYRTPTIYGNKVAYGYYAPWSTGSQWNIFVYDISTDAGRVISADKHNNQVLPAIYENNIVWLKNNDVYLFDVFLKRITATQYAANRPAIYGDKIVWTGNGNGNWDIYMYDISKGSTYRITTNNADQMNPAIYGDKIVWQDKRNGNWDIYQYDVSTNTEKRITTNNADQMNPAIYGDKIVWQDKRNGGNADIYMYSC